VAEAAVKQAEAALESAELDLKYTVIRSPVDGTVISRLVEVGQRLSANFAIPTLWQGGYVYGRCISWGAVSGAGPAGAQRSNQRSKCCDL
jgi:hypothetical protein